MDYNGVLSTYIAPKWNISRELSQSDFVESLVDICPCLLIFARILLIPRSYIVLFAEIQQSTHDVATKR